MSESPIPTKRAASLEKKPETCLFWGCNKVFYAYRYCAAHYSKYNRYGTAILCKKMLPIDLVLNRKVAKAKYKKSEKGKISNKKYRAKAIQRGISKFQCAKRRAQKKKACPKWANLDEIKRIYENCPIGHHVDHIIPLMNPIVCGLHVPWNLQYLEKSENLKKGNRL